MAIMEFDNIATTMIEREQQRQTKGVNAIWTGEAAVNDWNDRPLYEKNNWNVGERDAEDIKLAIEERSVFVDKQVETKESSVEQCNEAVQAMEAGDCSKFSQLPQFMREYYARKTFRKFFGRDTFDAENPFPPLDDEMKQRLEEEGMVNNPAFRIALNLLIERNAIDKEGNNIVPNIKEYDTYLNQRMLTKSLEIPSAENIAKLQNDYTENQLEEKLAKYEEKQLFLAKNLFMTQLGRIDINNDNGTSQQYTGKISELYAHSSRTAMILPPGDSNQQNEMLEAWRERALSSEAIKKKRCATHDFYRRVIHVNGDLKTPFKEIKLMGTKWLWHPSHWKHKPTTFFRNYGLNLALGGLGNTFNTNGYVDDNGRFGHVYMRAKKGSPYECGAILFGFENSSPGERSAIGQKHGGKAIGHDITPFYSNTSVAGKKYSGREVDLSHFKPEELSLLLRSFEGLYKKLQRRAKTDEAAKTKLNELNQKLSDGYMSATELANFMTSLGMDKEFAISSAKAGRSVKDSPYPNNQIPENMYQPEVDQVEEAQLNPRFKANMDSVKAKANYVDRLRHQWDEMASHTPVSFLNSPHFDMMRDAFQNYLKAFDNIMAGKNAEGTAYRPNASELSDNDFNHLRACEQIMISRAKGYQRAKRLQKQGGIENHTSQQGKDRLAMSIKIASFETDVRRGQENTFGQEAQNGFHTKAQEEEIKKNEARTLLAGDVQREIQKAENRNNRNNRHAGNRNANNRNAGNQNANNLNTGNRNNTKKKSGLNSVKPKKTNPGGKGPTGP